MYNTTAIPRYQLMGPFVPYIWVGGAARGIAFFADNDQDWLSGGACVQPRHAPPGTTPCSCCPAYQIERDTAAGTLTLIVNLISRHAVPPAALSGGSSCSRLPGAGGLVCVGHWHDGYQMYFHFLYELDPAPPHAVRAVSYPFRFRRFFGDERDRVQYAAGTTLDARAGNATLRISFGVADCVAAETTLRVPDVVAMLSGDLVMPRV